VRIAFIVLSTGSFCMTICRMAKTEKSGSLSALLSPLHVSFS
jgi:hypothetical protein